MSLIVSDQFRIIIGVGQTGLSVARYFRSRGLQFAACDTRRGGDAVEAFKTEFPDTELQLGDLDPEFLSRATDLIISPGVAKDQNAIKYACDHGARLLGDIDLFAREISAPVVAITGSNGKSTVTMLVAQMARKAGIRVAMGGNIGVPALDLLHQPNVELYVLELSSFQLETMSELKAKVAAVLNMSADHLDRYSGMPAYHRAKHRIFRGCEAAIFNREDALSRPLVPNSVRTQSFGLSVPDLGQYGLLNRSGTAWIARGAEALMPVEQMKLRGQHNVQNALAALALGESVGIEQKAMLDTLASFAGLEHRCEWVRNCAGVDWFNDSKGTNVGATLAAIEGLGSTLQTNEKILLIAGGQGKEQSFDRLKKSVKDYVRSLVLIGQDAAQLGEQIEFAQSQYAESLDQAVEICQRLAQPGDLVLLSPACASFDMFESYEHRGQRFKDLVGGLLC